MATPSGEEDWFPSTFLTFCTTSVPSCLTSSDRGLNCASIRLVSLSSVLLLLSCLYLTCQRCKRHGGHPGSILTSLYCFLGNVCGFTGAILSRQLHIQVLMAIVSAALDMLNVITCCIPQFFCRSLQEERRQRMIRRRRRSHLLAICFLTALTGGFLKSGILQISAPDGVIQGRRLFSVPLQDNTEVLGYVLGLLAFVITSTSRFPTLYKINKGKTLSRSHIFSGMLCSLAGSLYAAAILHYDTRVSFLFRAMPWLLSAVCGASLDLLTILLHWCRKATRQQPLRIFSEMENLLGDSSKDNNVMKPHGKQHPRNAKVCGKELDEKVVTRTFPLVRIDGCDTSCDSSVVSSDLEWDFEERSAQWCEAKAKPQDGPVFPLQEWPSNPKPFNMRTYASCILPQNGICCNEAVTNSK
ncbi:transmembrane protein 44 isoform X3 [Syngnathoides biaculeatus]|uniref:transmembrane protein 44 isoform X3 n=1 Tax=Syngnathoides biaculeatus TaxID=300417 RepID=UPI002ADDD88F|nr:transmembrane protein 44 isoform X3 [Syngnathoides biaculeatus]